MANFDYYAEARNLITELVGCGRTADAEKLRSVIEEGSTGSEILMGLRFYLLQFDQHLPFEGDMKVIAERLLSELNKALG